MRVAALSQEVLEQGLHARATVGQKRLVGQLGELAVLVREPEHDVQGVYGVEVLREQHQVLVRHVRACRLDDSEAHRLGDLQLAQLRLVAQLEVGVIPHGARLLHGALGVALEGRQRHGLLANLLGELMDLREGCHSRRQVEGWGCAGGRAVRRCAPRRAER